MDLSVGPPTRRVMGVLARLAACGVLLLLPACGVPALRQAEFGPPLPATYNGAATPDNAAHMGIDRFFNDPKLTQLILQGLAGNRELKALEEEVQIAGNEAYARTGAYLPFLAFGAGAGVDKPSLYTPEGAVDENVEYKPGRHFPNPRPDFRLGLNFLWQLDIWRELRNARDAAVQRYFAAVERRNNFVTRMVADIAENYYGLQALDNRIIVLNNTIKLFEDSLKVAQAKKAAGRGTELAVQRFEAEVRRNQSEKFITNQEIIEVENRINFLLNRNPQPVERSSEQFFGLKAQPLSVGVPAQLLQSRPDIRQAERELAAAGLDVLVARAHFFPRLDITAGVGYRSFNLKYLFATPEALVYNAAGDLTAPLLNRRAIQAEYRSANARQLQSVYNYQRVILNAFTEVVNRLAMVENYSKSLKLKQQQIEALVSSVEVANKLFNAARVEYVEVLLAQRDLMDARMVLVDTKRRQLSAVVNAYQALGGGNLLAGMNQHPPLNPKLDIVIEVPPALAPKGPKGVRLVQ